MMLPVTRWSLEPLKCNVSKAWLSGIMQIQPLTPLVDEFAGRLFGELDYIQEGLNAERFQVQDNSHCHPY